MLDVLTWLLVVEFLGLLALPIVFVLIPWLPDRGYTLAKSAGLLLAFYLLWLLASSPVVPNSIFSLLLILVALTVVSGRIAWYRQTDIKAFLRQEWRVLLLSEAVFLSMFFIWIVIRSHDAAINHTEQPMDFAFLNSSVVSQSFPPQDPWLAGESVSYYYFGYLIFGGLTRLAAVPTAVGYNLALALLPALAAAGIFGLAMNLVRLSGGSLRSAAISGLLGVFLLLGIANLESGLELVRASGSGSPGFWEWVDIKDLEGPAKSTTWYPSESGWWWWRATRVIDTLETGRSLDYTITEFPFFSFLLGDLHPHVMSLPFVLMFIGLVLNFFVAPIRLGLRWLGTWSGATGLLTLALTLGALGFINLWDLPVFGVLLVGAALAKGYAQEQAVRGSFLKAAPPTILVVALALLLYVPFYFTFDSQARGVLPVNEYVTRPFHFLVIWGLFLLIAVPFAVWELASASRRWPRRWREAGIAVSLVLLPWLLWSLVEVVVVWDPVKTVQIVWERLLHLLPLMLIMAAAVYAMLLWTRKEEPRPDDGGAGSTVSEIEEAESANQARPFPAVEVADEGDMVKSLEMAGGDESSRLARAFPLMVLALAMLLLIGPELFYLEDLFNNRMNTIFKLSYQAWALLALACSYALYYLGFKYSRSGPWIRIVGYAWIGVVGLGIMVSAYYPVAAAYTKTSGLAGNATLDGLAYLAENNVAELRGIQRLKEVYKPGEIIIEAVGDDYSEYGRVSASTGIPTVLGWTFHEQQWRGSRKPFEGREEAVKRLYQTQDSQEAKEIIDRYGVTYIFIGPRERARYGIQGLDKFATLGSVEFQEGNVVIYRVTG